MFVDRSADDYLFFSLVSGWSFVYEGCYGQSAEQLPALSTGGGRSAQEESGNYKEPQDLNTITHTLPNKDDSTPPSSTSSSSSAPQRPTPPSVSPPADPRVRQTPPDPARPGSTRPPSTQSLLTSPLFFLLPATWNFFFCFFLFFHLSDTHAHLWDICNSYSTRACK